MGKDKSLMEKVNTFPSQESLAHPLILLLSFKCLPPTNPIPTLITSNSKIAMAQPHTSSTLMFSMFPDQLLAPLHSLKSPLTPFKLTGRCQHLMVVPKSMAILLNTENMAEPLGLRS